MPHTTTTVVSNPNTNTLDKNVAYGQSPNRGRRVQSSQMDDNIAYGEAQGDEDDDMYDNGVYNNEQPVYESMDSNQPKAAEHELYDANNNWIHYILH